MRLIKAVLILGGLAALGSAGLFAKYMEEGIEGKTS